MENYFFYKFQRIYTLGICSFFIIIIISKLDQNGPLKKSYFNSFLVSIGNSSYATYISHIFVIAFIARIGTEQILFLNNWIIAELVMVTAALIVGNLLYVYCDRPAYQRLHLLFKSGISRK